MMQVKHYIAVSPIHGLGVFAAEDIPSGTVVWRYTEGRDFTLSQSEYGQLPEKSRNWIRHFGYYNESEGGWVVCADEARFMNHSLQNNVGDRGVFTVALSDIPVGTELTCNYYDFDTSAAEKIHDEINSGYCESEMPAAIAERSSLGKRP